jgi:HK97 family phage portal protein
MSPLHACAFAIDTLNSYASSNKATLDNGVTPSGVLSTEQVLDDSNFERLREQFKDRYAGATNSGKPMVLEGGLSWQQTGLSPREMEYIQGKRANELDVCKALRVPPQIIGIDGSQTFANYEQARSAFYEDTVIPTVNSLLSQISYALAADFRLPTGSYLCVDVDSVAALEPRRAERMKVIDALNSISINEKREGMGYGETEGGDVVLVNSSQIPLDMAGVDPVTDTGL